MKIVFIGTVDFSRHCLEELIAQDANLDLVITHAPSRIRYNSDYADLRPIARRHGIAALQVEKIGSPEVEEAIKSVEPDVIFVFGFSQIIPKSILEIPRYGCIGSHPALLPQNRGRHPLIWALVNGLETSGLTFFYLDDGVDSGDILWQKSFNIELDDDAQSLYEKMKLLASDAIRDFLPALATGAASRTPQDHSVATYWPKRGESDGEVRWSNSTLRIYNLIRGLTKPYVGAHTYFQTKKVVLWASQMITDPNPNVINRQPGEIVDLDDNGALVRTGDGTIRVTRYDVEADHNLRVGKVLGGR